MRIMPPCEKITEIGRVLMPSRTTIRQVAKACGFSKSTVSLALKDHPSVKRVSREIIQKTAREMGYQPNATLAALAQNRFSGPQGLRDTIAFISTKQQRGKDYLEGCVEEGARLGFNVEPHFLEGAHEVGRLLKILWNRGVQGLVLRGYSDIYLQSADQLQKFAVVSLSSLRNTLPVAEVTPDFAQSVNVCWEKARQRGYRRIGAAVKMHTPALQDDYKRYSACLLQQSTLFQPPGEEIIPPLLADHRDNRAIDDWLREHEPDCLIGFSAGDFWRLRASLGVEKAARIGFAHLHATPTDKYSGASPDQFGAAQIAVRQLDQLLRSGCYGFLERPPHIESTVLWHEGVTLPEKDKLAENAIHLPV